MYVFETFLAGIHWNALERILERVRNVNGTRSERKWNAFGTQMERVRNATGTRSERKWNANAVLGYFFFRKFSIFFQNFGVKILIKIALRTLEIAFPRP